MLSLHMLSVGGYQWYTINSIKFSQ